MKLSCRWVLFAGCLAVLAACEGEPTAIVAERMELSAARQLWNAQGMDDYRMRVRTTGAWGGAAAVITVRDGVPVSVKLVGEEGPGFDWLFNDYDTVEELFAILDHAVAEDADHIDAAYHSQYGLPVEVFIDYRETWADDEQGFIVETFERL